jgi:purine-binding chemotaxis protein CheW
MERQFCTFLLDGHHFGVEVSTVQEILRHQEMTRVPLASRVIRGLLNLRGQIVTAIDLRLRLSLPERAVENECLNLIVNTQEGSVSFLIDEIGDVVEVGDELFEPPPPTLKGHIREFIRGTYKLQEHLLLILDTEKTANLVSGQNPHTFAADA